MIHIFVISDGTGITAKHDFETALTQLPSKQHDITLFPEVRSTEKLHQIITQIIPHNSLNAHTHANKLALSRRTKNRHSGRPADPFVSLDDGNERWTVDRGIFAHRRKPMKKFFSNQAIKCIPGVTTKLISGDAS
ncbi:MAG: kinase/pyrophosphorylase [Calditrichaeota bacterium]|nr:kinase/pyrophosphorylase [Calditrichota bacterium]